MAVRSIVAIGASAGGIDALMRVVRDLPADLHAAVCVAVHQGPRTESRLPQVLGRCSPLPASLAVDGDPVEAGKLKVAAPDMHLVVEPGRLRLLRTARENGHRPAIDPLFRSAARAYGGGVVGVILSGADDDGTEGLLAIKANGGVALAQDPTSALFPRMPQSAVTHVPVDAILPASELGRAISKAVEVPVKQGEASSMREGDPRHDREKLEQNIAAWEDGSSEGSASGLTCPLCGGGVWAGKEGPLTRYHCHTGHEFSEDSYLREHAMVLETTLWQALRVLSERVSLLRRLGRQESPAARRMAEEADELSAGVEMFRQLLQRSRSLPQ